VAVRGPHHRDLAPDAVQADGAVRPQALDLPLAFQLQAELGEERDGGVQVIDDDGDVVHPLHGHVCQHRTAASRRSGVDGTDGSPLAGSGGYKLPSRRRRAGAAGLSNVGYPGWERFNGAGARDLGPSRNEGRIPP
jgi:hypothetical protein